MVFNKLTEPNILFQNIHTAPTDINEIIKSLLNKKSPEHNFITNALLKKKNPKNSNHI